MQLSSVAVAVVDFVAVVVQQDQWDQILLLIVIQQLVVDLV